MPSNMVSRIWKCHSKSLIVSSGTCDEMQLLFICYKATTTVIACSLWIYVHNIWDRFHLIPAARHQSSLWRLTESELENVGVSGSRRPHCTNTTIGGQAVGFGASCSFTKNAFSIIARVQVPRVEVIFSNYNYTINLSAVINTKHPSSGCQS